VIWVDVAGAVRRPGLYSLSSGARVAAAIARAGGVRSRANRAAVNLAAKLVDGQQVFVPAGGSAGPPASGGSMGASGGSGGAGTAGSAPASGTGAGTRISLSSASQAELEQLDGIGPALAQRIIQYRDQHGGFRSIEELQQVSGIGEKRFEALKGAIAP
jgi:competence protein ComEA